MTREEIDNLDEGDWFTIERFRNNAEPKDVLPGTYCYRDHVSYSCIRIFNDTITAAGYIENLIHIDELEYARPATEKEIATAKLRL